MRDAIGNLAKYYPIPFGHRDKTSFIHTSANLAEINRKRLEQVPVDGGSRAAWSEELQLDCYKNMKGILTFMAECIGTNLLQL